MLGSQRFHSHDKTNSGVVDSSEGVRRKGRTSSTTEVRLTGIEREYWIGTEISRLGGYGFRGTGTAGDGSFPPKRGENGCRLCEPVEKREKAAEEGGTRRGRIQLEPSETSGLCIGITRHPCDKTHAVFVRQSSAAAAESCKKMGR